MKKTLLILALLCLFQVTAQHRITRPTIFVKELKVGVGNSYSSSSFTVTATDKGILIPRLTTAQKNNISNPVNGLLVYDKTLKAFNYYNGTIWVSMSINVATQENDVRSVSHGTTSSIQIYKNGTWKSTGFSFTLK